MYSPEAAGQIALIQSSLARIPATLNLQDALAGQHLLLTGCTGFFGRWLLALLASLNRQGAAIRVSVVSRNPARFLAEQPQYQDCTWLHWVVCDIRQLESVPGPSVDLILHGAADTSAAAHAEPLELFSSIIGGAQRVLELAVRSGTRRVLFTGSGAQYGRLPLDHPVSESFNGACVSASSASAYGEAKRAQETLGAIYAKKYGIDVILTRCFAFAGPGLPLSGHFAIGNFVRDALNADSIVLNSLGEAMRSYLHGADLAAWLLTLLTRGESGQAYNVGSDQAVSIAELARLVAAQIAPHKPVLIRGQGGGSERSYYVPDITRAKELGLDVWTSLDESIHSMAEWARRPAEIRYD